MMPLFKIGKPGRATLCASATVWASGKSLCIKDWQWFWNGGHELDFSVLDLLMLLGNLKVSEKLKNAKSGCGRIMISLPIDHLYLLYKYDTKSLYVSSICSSFLERS